RGTHPDSLLLIDSIQSSLNSYTDLSPPSGLLYYQVGVVMPDTCSPTILRGQTSKGPFSQSYSNMKDYSMDQTDYFEVNPGEINLASAYGSSGRLEVFTNLSEWEVSSNQSWLNVSREEDKSGIILTALSENTLAYARTAIMTIYLNELPPKDVIVYQLGTNGTVGLNEQLQGKLTIYPNPFNQSTQIILPAFEEFINSYQLFDASGKIVREDEYMYANRISLQKGKLAKGVYYIRIQAKLTYVGKVIVY
ncbi:MAG: T9SS type A sorting domain-containing protein, partial [Bacteroidetes bacterium]|nr:T9SS type A sorting domain-containing protein [Bacteroidota bacterium]